MIERQPPTFTMYVEAFDGPEAVDTARRLLAPYLQALAFEARSTFDMPMTWLVDVWA